MLLEERWRLIQAGTDRGDIKMRNNKLFVHGKLYAKIINNTLELSETNEETSLSSAEDNPSITIHSDASATTQLSSPHLMVQKVFVVLWPPLPYAQVLDLSVKPKILVRYMLGRRLRPNQRATYD